jgi:hypothetical protein
MQGKPAGDPASLQSLWGQGLCDQPSALDGVVLYQGGMAVDLQNVPVSRGAVMHFRVDCDDCCLTPGSGSAFPKIAETLNIAYLLN